MAGVVDEPFSKEGDHPPRFAALGWAGNSGSRGASEAEAVASALRGYRSFIARTELSGVPKT